jgi:Family of unknown function (DUF5302)
VAASVPRMTEWNADDDGWERDMPGKGKKKGSAGPSEEMKAKFREALDKKHGHAGMDVSADGETSKIAEAHGPAKAQQMFRRKAGS